MSFSSLSSSSSSCSFQSSSSASSSSSSSSSSSPSVSSSFSSSSSSNSSLSLFIGQLSMGMEWAPGLLLIIYSYFASTLNPACYRLGGSNNKQQYLDTC